MSLSARFRHASRTLHLTLGLTIGLLSAVTGLTGASMAFRDEIDRALNPGLFQAATQGAPASMDAVEAAVKQAHPQAAITRVNFPDAPAAPYPFRIALAPSKY